MTCIDRKRLGRARLLLALVAVTAAALAAGPGAAQAASSRTCPNSFQVLHNDHIGSLNLSAGHYTITIVDRDVLGCQKAASLFRQFLEDYDGNLPGRWKVLVAKSGFQRDHTTVGFRVKKGSKRGSGGGRHPANGGRRCAAPFRVLPDDHIGKLKIPAGTYRITRLTTSNPNCQKAAKLFASFLQRPDGDLPDKWHVHAYNGSFTRDHTPNGFRIKPT